MCVFVSFCDCVCVSWLPSLLLQRSDNVNESTATLSRDKGDGGWRRGTGGFLSVFQILCCARFMFCENDERAVSQLSLKASNISPAQPAPLCVFVHASPCPLSVLSQFVEINSSEHGSDF